MNKQYTVLLISVCVLYVSGHVIRDSQDASQRYTGCRNCDSTESRPVDHWHPDSDRRRVGAGENGFATDGMHFNRDLNLDNYGRSAHRMHGHEGRQEERGPGRMPDRSRDNSRSYNPGGIHQTIDRRIDEIFEPHSNPNDERDHDVNSGISQRRKNSNGIRNEDSELDVRNGGNDHSRTHNRNHQGVSPSQKPTTKTDNNNFDDRFVTNAGSNCEKGQVRDTTTNTCRDTLQ